MKKLFLIPLLTLMCSVMAWGADITTAESLKTFLEAEGTASATVTDDIDISAAQIVTAGTKTLTVSDGVIISYKRQSAGANILVATGAKLTVLGTGTFQPVGGTTIDATSNPSNTSQQLGNRIIDVDGELVVGIKDDATNQPRFITTSLARGSAITVNPGCTVTLNNAYIHAAAAAIWCNGRLIINGGEYISVGTSKNGLNSGWYSYTLRLKEGSNVTINNGHFVGAHGPVEFDTEAIGDINGGVFESAYGHNYKTGADNIKGNYYALYVATWAVVNVYGGEFKVQTPNLGSNRVVLIGNDDAYNTYGVVNMYGGKYQEKAYVTKKKNEESSFPPSVPLTSQWYAAFAEKDASNAYAPLPAGYEYYETGDATYPYGVRAVEGKEADAIDPAQQAAQESDHTYTIPWQQATTWAADEVPQENTIVTIPVDAIVTVSKDEANKEAVADQVFVAQGATLKVEEGTTLTVGDGGMNIGNGGQIVVEAGATVKIGAAGVITTEEEALVIESSEEIQGTLIYDPAVSENTQPKASVRLYTKCYQKHASPYEYQWQRFAIPVIEMVSKPANDYVDQPLFAGQSEFKSYLFGWGGESWVQPTGGWLGLEPNKGYQVANNTIAGGITYTFHGNLIANNNGNYDFEANGFSFFGNSYTAPINVRSLLNEFNNQGGFEQTIHVYDMEGDGFIAMTLNTFDDYDAGVKDDDEIKQEIASMQAFIIKGTAGEAANMSYETSIWNPLVNPSNNAPQRRSVSSNRDIVVLNVAANGKKDRITLRQSDEFSAEFDNSADASKYMNEGTFNIYANTEIGDLAEVSTNELNNTILGFQSAGATEYTLTCSGQKGESFILRDLLTGAEVNLEKGATYTFAQQPNTTNEARFQIVDVRMAPTAVENVQNVKKAEGIYTVLGKYLGAADQLDKLPAGMYIVNGVKIVK